MTSKKLSSWRLHWRPVALACALAGSSLSAQALNLGRFSVQSALGEPLRGEVEITQFTTEDLRSLKVQLAAPNVFEQAGMSYHPALVDLVVKTEVRSDGRPFIVLMGRTPAHDNFIDLILETQWRTGRLAMNYTALLSPTRKSTVPNKEATTVVPPITATDKDNGSIQPTLSASAPPNTAAIPSDADTITVSPGDTASKLALQHLPSQISLEQMLLAMVRANPDAFIEDNANLIRAGAQIRMPNAQQAAETSAEEARQTLVQQTADFAAYAQRLATSPVKTLPKASREMSGTVSPRADGAVPALPEQDKLTLSKGQVSTQNSEATLAAERESKEVAEQLATLQKNVQALQALKAPPAPTSTDDTVTTTAAPTAPVAAPPIQAQTASALEHIKQNPALAAGIAAVIAALLGFVAWLLRKPTDSTEPWPVADEPTLHSQAEPASPGNPFAHVMPDLDLNLDSPSQEPTPVTPVAAASQEATVPATPESAASPEVTETAHLKTDEIDSDKLTLALQLLSKGELELARVLISSVAISGSAPMQAKARQMLGQDL